ncbi:MAG: STAS domain-containing protein [Chlamydiia bacterium]|nr:STAS domain-containing protein [Chlamydiia bacterium]
MREPVGVCDTESERIVTFCVSAIDSSNARSILEILHQHIPDRLHLLIDLSNVAMINSSGLGVFFTLGKICKERGVKMHVRGAAPPIIDLFKMVNADIFFDWQNA